MRRCIPFSLSIGLSLLILAGAAHSAIITVDKNAGNNADFTSLQTAHNAAASGDTLFVAGSSQGYSRLTLDRTLFVFGPGYFLNENPDTQDRLRDERNRVRDERRNLERVRRNGRGHNSDDDDDDWGSSAVLALGLYGIGAFLLTRQSRRQNTD